MNEKEKFVLGRHVHYINSRFHEQRYSISTLTTFKDFLTETNTHVSAWYSEKDQIWSTDSLLKIATRMGIDIKL